MIEFEERSMFNSRSGVHKDIIVNILFPYLDQVSIYRLTRCSKTLFEMLQDFLPKQAVLDYFNWQFKTTNSKTLWNLARKRHESNKWCLGGCGKQRKPFKEKIGSLIVSKRTRVLKEPINICAQCSINRKVWVDMNDDIFILEQTKRLKQGIIRRDQNDPFLSILNDFELETTKRSARIKDARVGDVLVPKYRSYNFLDELPQLKIVDIRLSNWCDKNELDRIFVMNDGSTISSYNGQRWREGCSNRVYIYVKHPNY